MLVALCNSTCKLYIGLLYRPPSSPASVFETLSSHLLDVSVSSFSNFVLLGDFNVDYNNLSHPLFSNLCNNIVNNFSLTQVVPGYTHSGPSGTCSLIDLVFISCQSNHGFVENAPKNYQGIWRYANADFQAANQLLEAVDWESLIVDDIDVAWQSWEREFMGVMHQCVPKSTLPAKKNLPWLSRELTTSIRSQDIWCINVLRELAPHNISFPTTKKETKL